MDSEKIYKKYKDVCPNSNAPYNPTSANISSWLMHIDIARKNLNYSNTNRVHVDKDDLDAYTTLSSSRRVLAYSTAPAYIKLILKDNVDKIKQLYPFVYDIYIEGSYAKGDFVDSETTEAEKEILKLFKDVDVISDFDFSVNDGSLYQHNYYNGNDIIPRSGGHLIWNISNGYT